MFEDDILTPGKKIKRIRTQFGIFQKEIIGNKSTNLLGQIENGKTTLIHDTAVIVVENINNIFKQRGLEIRITIDWLMEDIQIQITRKAKIYIDNLEKSLNSDNEFVSWIEQTESFMQSYILLASEKIKIFDLAIGFYTKTYDFNKKKIYLLRLKDLYSSLNEHKAELDCMYEIMIIYFRLDDFKYVIDLGMYIINSMELYSMENELFTKKIYFNIALSYKKIGENKCLEYLRILENEMNLSLKERLDIKLLKANHYKDKKEFKKAELMCLDIIKNEEYHAVRAAAYSTMCEIYLENNNIQKAEKYIDKAINLDIKNDDYLVEFLYNALKVNVAKLNSGKVKIYFNKSIEKAINTNNVNMQFNICKDSYEYFATVNDFKFILTILELISTLNNIDKKMISIYLNAINYFKDKDNNIRDMLLEKLVKF